MTAIYSRARAIAADAARGALCGAGGAARIYSDFNKKVGRKGVPSAAIAARLADIAADALQGFCPLPVDPRPPIRPGFSGGQTPGVVYRVTYRVFQQSVSGNSGAITPINPPSFTQQIDLIGPIGGPWLEWLGDTGFDQKCRKQFYRWNIPFGSGLNAAANLAGGPTRAGSKSCPLEYPQVIIESAVRLDGLPDTGGDRPPEPPPLPPGTPPTTRPPITEPITPGPGLPPISVTFSPIVGVAFIDADLNVKVPVSIKVGSPNFNFDIDLDFDVNLTDPTAPPTPRPPRKDPDNPDGRPDPPDCPPAAECEEDSDEDDEPPPPGSKDYVVGIKFKLAKQGSRQKSSEIAMTKGPVITAPRNAHARVKLATSPDGDNATWTEDFPVKGTEQIWINPLPKILFPVDVVCTPETGWVVSSITFVTKKL